MRPRVGLLDIRDVASCAYPWNSLRLDADLPALGLAGAPGEAFRAFEPPPCLVVVVDGWLPNNTAPYAAWLVAAQTLIVVREWDDDDGSDADRELRSILDEEWRTKLAGPATLSFIDRRGGDPEPLRRALAEARVAAAAAGDWKDDVAPTHTTATLQPGRWLTIQTRLWPLEAGEIAHDGRTAYLCDAERGKLWPLDGSEPIVSRAGQPGVPSPDRATYLVCTRGEGGTRSAELRTIDGRSLDACPTYARVPIGFDPCWPIATAGHRVMFYWHLVRAGRVAVLSSAAHDWPCGHAKKLFGYDDNDPRWVHLSPRADAYLSVFDHDALVASAVPVRWEVRDGVAVAGRPAPDPLRALLFTSDEQQRAAWNATPPDEDARGGFPVVVLGASDEVRYAVGLERETYRLRGEALEQLSAGGGGYAVYDAGHRQVRNGRGRLLGGWNGIATLEHEGELFREELASGQRRSLGRSDRPIARVLPIAGTENVMLVGEETGVPGDPGQATTRVRLV